MTDPLRFVCRHIIAPAWARWEGSDYLRHYRRLCQTQWDDLEAIRSRQLQRLRSQLTHAAATVPFYRRLFSRLQIRPDDLRTLEDLRHFPILTKQDIRERADDLLSDAYRGQRLHVKKTSGSTGVPLSVLLDEAGLQFKRACTLRSDEWSGWRLGERVAKVWGNPEYRHGGWRGWLRHRLLDRADYLDTLRLDDSALSSFARRLFRRQPSLIFGHAHSVYLLAQFVAKHGPDGIRPKGILTTAMVLHPWQRRVIEETFACRVTNRYGCEEVSLIACECGQQQGLHINADGVYVEILRDGQPAKPGQPGAVVVTDLVNRAMPLIRYKVGDVASFSPHSCSCGRGLPLLARIEGREADYVTTESGDLISGISLTENFALKVPGVAQMQIIQESRTFFRFRIVPSATFGEASRRELSRLVRERFGPRTEYEVEYVEAIAPEPSGKYRFCISKVPVRL
jgi:phenylacetate-CoA ligase